MLELTESQKREEAAKKALDTERQCVADVSNSVSLSCQENDFLGKESGDVNCLNIFAALMGFIETDKGPVLMLLFVCVGWDQLEKALKEMETEGLEVKETAERQLSQAKGMLASVEEKSSQVDIQLAKVQGEHTQANCKLAESQLQLQEVEAREDALCCECCSLMSEYVHGCVLLCIE